MRTIYADTFTRHCRSGNRVPMWSHKGGGKLRSQPRVNGSHRELTVVNGSSLLVNDQLQITKAQRMTNFIKFQIHLICAPRSEVAKEIENGELRFSNRKIGRWMR